MLKHLLCFQVNIAKLGNIHQKPGKAVARQRRRKNIRRGQLDQTMESPSRYSIAEGQFENKSTQSGVG